MIYVTAGENDNITDLDLSWNHIRMKGGKEIAQGVKDNVCLKVFNLSWNGFGDDGAKDIGAVKKNSKKIYIITFKLLSVYRKRNKICNDRHCNKNLTFSYDLGVALKSCSLTTLDLTCNRIQSEGFLSLVQSLKDADTLKVLKVIGCSEKVIQVRQNW